MASGNHEMYIRRRRPDTLEVRKTLILADTKHYLVQVQQMKSQKRDEEAMRAKEKEALAKESAARFDNLPKCQQTILSNYETFAGQRRNSFGRRWLPSLLRWRRE